MGQIEQLHERLLSAASLLDTAAEEIRDLPLEPVGDNIERIGKALVEIFDILQTIYAVRADLTPSQLELTADQTGANKRLTIVLNRAYVLAGSNKVAEAISELNAFASAESSAAHKEIAEHEAARLKTRTDR